jgi:arylsulfatase A-like enzyme
LKANHDHLASEVDLLAEILACEGYATASFNNGGLVSHEFGFHRGFDLYCEIDPIGDWYLDNNMGKQNRSSNGTKGSLDRTLDWIEDHKKKRFFLFLHTFMIHDYMPPLDLAKTFNRGYTGGLEPGREAAHKLTQLNFKKEGLSRDALTFYINMYDATIRAADMMIGQLLKKLGETGLLDRTLLVITSDHGEEFLEHGGVRHTRTVYEELIRIPLIISIPGKKKGKCVDTMVNQVDIMPTLLELLDIEIPEKIQGRSLLSLINGKEEQDRWIIAQTYLPAQTFRACFIKNGWKYIKGSTDSTLLYPAPNPRELYLLTDDPEEMKNLMGINEREGLDLGKLMDGLEANFQKLNQILDKEKGEPDTISERLKETLRQQGYIK